MQCCISCCSHFKGVHVDQNLTRNSTGRNCGWRCLVTFQLFFIFGSMYLSNFNRGKEAWLGRLNTSTLKLVLRDLADHNGPSWRQLKAKSSFPRSDCHSNFNNKVNANWSHFYTLYVPEIALLQNPLLLAVRQVRWTAIACTWREISSVTSLF